MAFAPSTPLRLRTVDERAARAVSNVSKAVVCGKVGVEKYARPVSRAASARWGFACCILMDEGIAVDLVARMPIVEAIAVFQSRGHPLNACEFREDVRAALPWVGALLMHNALPGSAAIEEKGVVFLPHPQAGLLASPARAGMSACLGFVLQGAAAKAAIGWIPAHALRVFTAMALRLEVAGQAFAFLGRQGALALVNPVSGTPSAKPFFVQNQGARCPAFLGEQAVAPRACGARQGLRQVVVLASRPSPLVNHVKRAKTALRAFARFKATVPFARPFAMPRPLAPMASAASPSMR